MGHLNAQNFHQAYVLAGRVKRKLVSDANNPRSGLRSLVLQANLLDNLMGDIDEYSHARYLENKAAALKLQRERLAQSKVSQVKAANTNNTKPDPVAHTSIEYNEVESESSDDEDYVDTFSSESESDYSSDEDCYDTPDELAQLVTAVTQSSIRRENHSFIEEEELTFEENYFAPAIAA
ncbi:hypothetical protein DIURU_002555 [Diutina rugosa]|uniref:Uncharacterized protein n=1 Tax=Diutina rugosa TaxID=5481 RepID=A0A642UPW0_DIURU|nr:uncharacterized protein DIURU_002555 [Diutina rugosa]KAA8903127.1 hypothetical protein DIURU_002555 [Diutina rugosa]